MSDIVIRAAGLGKKYIIGHETRYGTNTFCDGIARGAHAFTRKAGDLLHGRPVIQGDELEEVWALRDVSFEVHRGEVIGIIGRNGAGKSTLLKILSQITEPTSGRVRIQGRVASLLEVGTGFHQELTGRENIFLNGAILGMTRAEVRRKFDDIVAFAEISKFLDTPVKRYSSGMYMRLAFGVAAHLEPEILIVDEVLAVGDAQFQKKCMGKIGDVAKGGRTVLFVSHNMTAVRNLCARAVWLYEGSIAGDDDAGLIITKYLSHDQGAGGLPDVDLTNWANRCGSGEARIIRARLLDHHGNVSSVLQRLKPATIEFTLTGDSRVRINLSTVCMTMEGVKVLQLGHQDTPGFEPGVLTGPRTVRVDIPALPLQCGTYQWVLGVHSDSLSPIDVVSDVLCFTVDDDLATSPRPYRSISENGLCTLLAHWQFANNSR